MNEMEMKARENHKNGNDIVGEAATMLESLR